MIQYRSIVGTVGEDQYYGSPSYSYSETTTFSGSALYTRRYLVTTDMTFPGEDHQGAIENSEARFTTVTNTFTYMSGSGSGRTTEQSSIDAIIMGGNWVSYGKAGNWAVCNGYGSTQDNNHNDNTSSGSNSGSETYSISYGTAQNSGSGSSSGHTSSTLASDSLGTTISQLYSYSGSNYGSNSYSGEASSTTYQQAGANGGSTNYRVSGVFATITNSTATLNRIQVETAYTHYGSSSASWNGKTGTYADSSSSSSAWSDTYSSRYFTVYSTTRSVPPPDTLSRGWLTYATTETSTVKYLATTKSTTFATQVATTAQATTTTSTIGSSGVSYTVTATIATLSGTTAAATTLQLSYITHSATRKTVTSGETLLPRSQFPEYATVYEADETETLYSVSGSGFGLLSDLAASHHKVTISSHTIAPEVEVFTLDALSNTDETNFTFSRPPNNVVYGTYETFPALTMTIVKDFEVYTWQDSYEDWVGDTYSDSYQTGGGVIPESTTTFEIPVNALYSQSTSVSGTDSQTYTLNAVDTTSARTVFGTWVNVLGAVAISDNTLVTMGAFQERLSSSTVGTFQPYRRGSTFFSSVTGAGVDATSGSTTENCLGKTATVSRRIYDRRTTVVMVPPVAPAIQQETHVAGRLVPTQLAEAGIAPSNTHIAITAGQNLPFLLPFSGAFGGYEIAPVSYPSSGTVAGGNKTYGWEFVGNTLRFTRLGSTTYPAESAVLSGFGAAQTFNGHNADTVIPEAAESVGVSAGVYRTYLSGSDGLRTVHSASILAANGQSAFEPLGGWLAYTESSHYDAPVNDILPHGKTVFIPGYL